MKNRIGIGAALTILLVAAQAIALSPPWYELQRRIQYSVGQNDCLSVSGHEGGAHRFYIDIQTCDDHVAASAAFLLKRVWRFGGVKTIVRVFDTQAVEVKPNRVVQDDDPGLTVSVHVQNLLEGNRFFRELHISASPGAARQLWPVMAPEVIQYWNDDIGDLYGNVNAVAADVFRGVCLRKFFKGAVLLGWTTAPVESSSSSSSASSAPAE